MAINFFGEVQIGTHVVVESGASYTRTKVENGGVYNEYVGKDAIQDNETEQVETVAVDNEGDDDKLVQFIASVSKSFKKQNHWFAIIKPLMWKGLIAEGDYEGAVTFIKKLFPNGVNKQFTADDIRKLDCFSMSKKLEKWDENNAPLHGARYMVIKAYTEAFWNLIK